MPGWLKWLMIGCGTIVAVAFLGMVGCVVWLGSGPASGVKLPNQMDAYALEYIDEHDLLNPGEQLRAYYDVTMSMDGTEAAIVTDHRVIYHHNGETTDIALADVVEVAHRQETIIGDIIEVVDVQGNALLIEIAPLNDGPAFLRALERARAAYDPPQDAAVESD